MISVLKKIMIIIGIGIDLIDCRRVKSILSNHYRERFLERIYLHEEREYIIKKLTNNNSPKYDQIESLQYGKIYSAKESILKSLGTGISKGIGWKDVEIIRSFNNSPHVSLKKNALDYLTETYGIGSYSIRLSLTDEWPYVQSSSILLKDI